MRKKVRIAFVSQPFDNVLPPPHCSIGIWTYEVARRLTRSAEVVIYAKGGCFGKKQNYHQRVGYQCIPVALDYCLLGLPYVVSKFYKARLPLFASRLFFWTYVLRVAKDLRARQCDIVHIHNFSQFVPLIRAVNPKTKIVLHLHCEWLTQLNRSIIQQRLTQVDLIVGCSNYITQKICNAFPEFARRCRTVYNGVNVNQFCAGNVDSDAMKKTRAQQLLFVGRVSPEKGVHVLLDAFRQVVTRCPQAQLKIVGPQRSLPAEFLVALSDDPKVADLAKFYPGNYLAHLQKRLSPDVASRVSFIKTIPHGEVTDHFRDTAVFIFPSVWDEPFGMPLVEAMASKVPTVSTQTGGITEIVEDRKTGLLVEPGNANALAEAILCLLENEGLRKSMGEAGRKRAVDFFSWELIVEKVLCEYADLIQ